VYKTGAIDNGHSEPSVDQDKAFEKVDNSCLRVVSWSGILRRCWDLQKRKRFPLE